MWRPLVKLSDRIAIVTGGTQGIGRCVAERLAFEGAAVVVVASGSQERADAVADKINATGGKALAKVADLTQPLEIRAVVKDVLASHGKVDILVNCAGVFVPTPIGEAADDNINRTIDVNLRGTFFAIDAVAGPMKACRSGKIVSVASVAAYMGFCGYAMYCASKAAIVMMTRALACELASYGINVNAIAPGNTATPMNADIRTEQRFQPMLQAMTARTPSGRTYSTPEEMAGMVAYLVSDDARAMHGSTVLMDEGFSAGM
jgi:3-oxoacyl-[acyl-carrier protein] reductase